MRRRQAMLWLDHSAADGPDKQREVRDGPLRAVGHAQDDMTRTQACILRGPLHPAAVVPSARRNSRAIAVLAACIALWLLSSYCTLTIRSNPSNASALPIVTLASSAARLHSNELAITLRSLLSQTVEPQEIRVYLNELEKDLFAWHKAHSKSRLSRYLNDERIGLYYVEDVGPSTKFVYAIRDMLERGKMDQAIIVLDDDHSYSPDLVATLVQYSQRQPFMKAAVGLRGWRVRRDLHWGVPSQELDDHVAMGWKLTEPYRVSVLTANEGYLIRPRYFVDSSDIESADSSSTLKVPLLDLKRLNTSAAHLVDDIWLNGHLSMRGIARYVVPLEAVKRLSSLSRLGLAGAAIPSIDVTKAHPLEGRIQREGYTRTVANWVALQIFKDAWRNEDLYYYTSSERRQMTAQEAQSVLPKYRVGLAGIRVQGLKLFHHLCVRLLFGQ